MNEKTEKTEKTEILKFLKKIKIGELLIVKVQTEGREKSSWFQYFETGIYTGLESGKKVSTPYIGLIRSINTQDVSNLKKAPLQSLIYTDEIIAVKLIPNFPNLANLGSKKSDYDWMKEAA